MATSLRPTPILEGRAAELFYRGLNEKHSKKKEKFLKECSDVYKEIKHFNKTEVPRCPVCKSDFVKVGKYEWQPSCNCFKQDIRLCKG